jgi:hypothetical protein
MQGKASGATSFDVGPSLPQQRVSLEVDRARQREFKRWLLIGLVLLAATLFDAWQRSAPFSYGYQLEELRRLKAEQEDLGRHFTLEIDTLSSPDQIERLARTRFHFVPPGQQDAVVLELVVPPEQPPSSVVASR